MAIDAEQVADATERVEARDQNEDVMMKNNITTTTPTPPPPAATAPVPAPGQANASRMSHPEADLIREKIDWYFCDENLKRDQRILNAIKRKGDNTPVNLFEVTGRLKHVLASKASNWQIIDACRLSQVVDVVDKNHIRRKVPYVLEDDDDEDGIWGDGDKRPRLKPIPAHPAIKAGTYLKTNATGFEMGFADAPMTPQEYEEEKELYAEDIDIPSRIGHAIERYLARRKMTIQYQKLFADFLRFGGVYPANRIAQGESKKAIMADEELSKDEKLEMCAQYDVDVDEKLDDTKWVIDFEGVAKAYLSTEFAQDLDEDFCEAKVDNQCEVISNFYNYLLHHDVCPEYTTEIKAALRVTAKARDQLKNIQDLASQFPTPFSTACSVLFGGAWKEAFMSTPGWADLKEDGDAEMKLEHAKVLVGAAVAMLAPINLYDALCPDYGIQGETGNLHFEALTYTDKRFVTLEVVKLERADEDTVESWKSAGLDAKAIKSSPLGTVTCKYWDMPNGDEWDIDDSLRFGTSREAEYTFWLEDDILSDCFKGMKLAATICKLDVKEGDKRENDGGVWVLDSVSRIYCSFFTWLPNELARGKVKMVEWNEEEALMGCRHSQADAARQVLLEMNWEKKKAEKAAKAEGRVREESED